MPIGGYFVIGVIITRRMKMKILIISGIVGGCIAAAGTGVNDHPFKFLLIYAILMVCVRNNP